jgi:hypothetical protein
VLSDASSMTAPGAVLSLSVTHIGGREHLPVVTLARVA